METREMSAGEKMIAGLPFTAEEVIRQWTNRNDLSEKIAICAIRQYAEQEVKRHLDKIEDIMSNTAFTPHEKVKKVTDILTSIEINLT